MSRYCLPFLFLVISVNATAQIPSTYYNGTQNLTGYELKAKLNEIVCAKKIGWNYGDLPEFYKQTDKDRYYENDTSVLDIYSENPTSADPYNYWYYNNNLIGGASNEGEGWNREHVYSQSFFFSNYPMYADLHFIIPTDARVNQRRSNFPYAKVNSAQAFTSMNGTKVGLSATLGYTNTVTEPIDEFKGDIARMLMYIAVRYENMIPFFDYNNVRNPIDSNTEKAFKNWYIPLLLSWNQQDPVSQKEIDRNNTVYNLQGNRNPFIDHPEFAQAIWGSLSSSTTVPLAPYQLNVVAQGKRFITVSWPYVNDPQFMGYELFLNNAKVGSTKSTTFTFTNLEPNTSYTLSIRSYSKSYVRSPFTTPITATTAASDTFSNNLYISKFIKGSGNNNAIEITNNTGYTVDLRHYYLNMRQINNSTGTLYWSNNKLQLEGTVAQGKKIVIINPGAQLPCFSNDSAHAISKATVMTFDGKLAVDLLNDSILVDRMGYADVVINYAVGKSLYRKPEIKQPTFIFDTAQWIAHPTNYCDGLGVNPPSTRLANVGAEKPFKIYPNPVTSGILHISGARLEKVSKVNLVAVDGRLIATYEQPFKNSNTLYLPKNLQGLYVLFIDGYGYKIIVE